MATNSQAPSSAEVSALLIAWQKLERASAAVRLRTERSALRTTRDTVQLIVSRAADQLEGLRSAPRLSKLTALGAIQSAANALREATTQDVLEARTDAREASLKRATIEIEHLTSLLTKDGWESEHHPDPPAPDVPDTDAIRAAAAGAAISSRWAALGLGAVTQWETVGTSGSLAAALRRTVALLDPQISKVLSTEISEAFADEHIAALEPLSDYPWSAQVFKVWSAMLDGRVCQRCYELDGRAVPTDHPWPEGATQPLHPHCRCMEVPLYIPKPKALTDVSLDYAAYKAEVRDQVRASRHSPAAGRHAAQFIERSRAGRSPIVISKDFAVGKLRTGTR